jgi:NitT/TauT family transport system permease protein
MWEAACHRLSRSIPSVLQPPSAAFAAMVAHWKTFAYHSYVTLWVTMVGFALAVAFGIVLGLDRRLVAHDLSRALSGDGRLQHDPEGRDRAAPDPVVRHRRGARDHHRVPDLVLPIVVNVATGLATTEPELEDVLRALGAGKLDIMLKVGIPRALPYLFGSLKVAITLAFVGTIVSETVGANAGLGYLISLEGASFRMANVYAALLLLAFEGVLMYALFAWIEQYFTRWAFRSQMSAGG